MKNLLSLVTWCAFQFFDEFVVVLFEAFNVNFEARKFELERVVEAFELLRFRQ